MKIEPRAQSLDALTCNKFMKTCIFVFYHFTLEHHLSYMGKMNILELYFYALTIVSIDHQLSKMIIF